VTVTGSATCGRICAFRPHGRSAEHCARHPEQDSEARHGARRGESVAAGGVDATAPEHFLVASTARISRRILRIVEDPADGNVCRSPAASECFRTTRRNGRCSASTVSLSAAGPRLDRADTNEGTHRCTQYLRIGIRGRGFPGVSRP
jgi:hypothetical protein